MRKYLDISAEAIHERSLNYRQSTHNIFNERIYSTANPSEPIFKKSRLIFGLVLALVFTLLHPTPLVWAQASLAAEDKIDEIPVNLNTGLIESFTVIRDAMIPEQWYYVPDRPRLFVRQAESGPEPDFTLIRYQFKDPSNSESMVEGGLLQFAASLAIPPEAIPQLTKVIADKHNMLKNKIRLAALPIKQANVAIYSPKEGKLLAEAPQGAGIAPTFATQKMVFMMPLTRIGSDVYDELVNGNTGVPVVIDFTYTGLTPPGGFKVDVDWDQSFKYYSKNRKLAASFSWKGLFGASADLKKEKIRQTLEENKCIKIEVIEGSGFTDEDATKFMEPILARINQELVDKMVPPDKIDPSVAGGTSMGETTEPTDEEKEKGEKFIRPKGGVFGGIGYSVALRDVKVVKKGKETINFNVRQHVERKTLAGGFIGIGRYPKEIREKLVTVVPPGPWKEAYLILPSVGDSEDLGIQQVDLQVSLRFGDQMRPADPLTWKPGKGWTDKDGNSRRVESFALTGLKIPETKVNEIKFESLFKITTSRDVIRVVQIERGIGQAAITSPFSVVEVVTVDGSALNWNKLDPTSSLLMATVELKSDERSQRSVLRPRNVDGTWLPPKPLNWLVLKPEQEGSAPVISKVLYRLKGGKIVPAPLNDQDIREMGNLVLLDDTDWQPQ